MVFQSLFNSYTKPPLMKPWMKAVARLGLGLARTSIRNIRFRTGSAVLEDLGEKSIYLCFEEIENQFAGYYKNYVARRIVLNEYNAFSDDEEGVVGEEELPVLAQLKSKVTENFRWTSCTVLGSKIVLPYARNKGIYTDICWIDMVNPKKFYASSQKNSTLRSFTESIVDLNQSSDQEDFTDLLASTVTALMPMLSNSRLSTVFLDDVNKVLSWKVGTESLCYYDVGDPKNGWTRVNDCAFRKGMSTVVNKPLFIYEYHPNIGDFYLMLNYTPYEPLRVSAFFVSKTFDFFRRMEVIQLPESCSKYLDSSDNNNACRPVLVELGGRNFGLLMNKFYEERRNGSVLLLTFQYDIKTNTTIENSKPNIQIQIRLLGTRRFRYNAMIKTKFRKLYDTCLIGAFSF